MKTQIALIVLMLYVINVNISCKEQAQPPKPGKAFDFNKYMACKIENGQARREKKETKECI